MKFLSVLVGFAMTVTVIYCSADSDAWENYKKKHGKDYNITADGGKEDAMRKELFLNKTRIIEQHNSEKFRSFKTEINKFSDMLPSEFAKYLGLRPSLAPPIRLMDSISTDLYNRRRPPASLDYRNHFCMPAVKNQGQCGSCWAFAAIAPLEFAKCTKHGRPVVLSEQQLVDCDKLNGGCGGGWYTLAWVHIWKAWGSAQESLYPYNAQDNACTYSWFMARAKVFTYRYVPSNNMLAMQQAIQKYGLVATAFTVVDSFGSYANGVYDDNACDGPPVNHAVVIVGWGTLNGVDYWIVRNSWGPDWGQNGYIYVQRGVNKCSIEAFPAYVLAF
ncbi:hypothetical protein GHT06_014817 [Daphnia sinensis]|uniref:Uncharacterized protein n=1 Tax=Daphnia sinensis TaxID=1820382 RepID=A0AAD5KQD6_9CRUS|nr:hypothetical protein GHT06_014817 [Daphnia sinensis]